MKRVLLAAAASLCMATAASADTFTCNITSNGYKNCTYVGFVESVYVNKNGLVLIYPESPFDTAQMENIGLTGVRNNRFMAAGHVYSSSAETEDLRNVEAAKALYTLALSAQLAEREVVVSFTERTPNQHLLSVGSGYLRIDRMTMR